MNLAIINKNPLFDFVEQYLNKEYNCLFICNKEDLKIKKLIDFNPQYCIFLHWSYKISSTIYENYKCILFHMTDLPYGRGGSPLQNLIVRKFEHTRLSAITVVANIDEGDIYLKRELDLSGSATSIFKRAGELMIEMIDEIINQNIIPIPQKGEPVYFKRRKPEDGNLLLLQTTTEIYDYIRMLDAPGYPNAYLETQNFRFEFLDASLINDETITANVRISKK